MLQELAAFGGVVYENNPAKLDCYKLLIVVATSTDRISNCKALNITE